MPDVAEPSRIPWTARRIVAQPYRFQTGETPVLISFPHAGLMIPDDVGARMTDAARTLVDADRHLDRLYQFAPALGAGWIVPTVARTVVDLNRSADDAGAGHGGACPTATFAGAPIYRDARLPDATERTARIAAFWTPYHDALAAELGRIRDRFGVAVLLDAHSVSRCFAPDMPDLSIGTAGGTTCDAALLRRVMGVLGAADGFAAERDGTLSGGFTVRRHADPASGIHAVQLDIVRDLFMDPGPPWGFRNEGASLLRPHLERLVAALIDWGWSRSTLRSRSSTL